MTGKGIFSALEDVLVCPACYHGLEAGPADTGEHAWLHCAGCGRFYPVQDGIPVMLAQRATSSPPLD